MSATVYVVAAHDSYTHDVYGVLLTEEGEVLWRHISSSIGFLRGDLTTTFTDRRERLEHRYPGGYNIVVCTRETLPEAVAAKHRDTPGGAG